MTRLLAFGLVLTSCSNLWISRNLAKAKQLNNLEQLSGAALFVYNYLFLFSMYNPYKNISFTISYRFYIIKSEEVK